MKQIHGKIIILFFILLSSVFANTNKYCSYDIKSSKSNIYINEPFYITFHTRQKTKNEVMFFDLKAQNNDSFDVIALESKRHEFNYHDAEKTFTFLVFAKKEGDFKLKFDFQVRRASDDAVAQAYTGSRDNVKSIPTTNVKITTPSVSLHVEPLKQDVDAIGDFRISMSIDKKSSNSYDAINVKYNLVGIGYLDDSYEPIKDIKNTSIFRGKKVITPKATNKGYTYNIEYNYAIVSTKSFKLPEVVLRVFNHKQNRYINKTINKVPINITKLDVSKLLDDNESPKSDVDFDKYIDYLYDVFIFIAGFLSAYLLRYLPKNKDKKDDISKAVRESKTKEELLKAAMPLVNRYSLHVELKELEAILYNNAKLSFKDVKVKILKKLK
jgi:hypothetical protein